MRSRCADQQRELFELNDPPIRLCDQQKRRLLPLGETMLLEILIPTNSKEVSDDEGQL